VYIRIAWLFPELMNIYGDRGNVISLVERCVWRGIGVEVDGLGPGEEVPEGRYDLFFMGGGQDREQELVCRDLLDVKGESIKREIEAGAAALVICGGYQLFATSTGPSRARSCKG